MNLEDARPSGLSMPMLMLTVFVGIAALALAGSFVPEPYRWATMILLPAVVMAVLVPPAVRRWTLRPLEDQIATAHETVRVARRELHQERSARAVLRELDRGLDQTADEDEALQLIGQALVRLQPDRAYEVHLVDPVDPVLVLRVATAEDALPGQRVSPWDSLAARTGTTLAYASSERLDVCGHLSSRLRAPHAAVAVPLQATGRLLGVLYVFDSDGTVFPGADVVEIEDTAAIISARIAVLRSSALRRNTDTVDRLTGLPDRAAMQERVIRLLQTRQPFALAVADVDALGAVNRTFGTDAGDRALRTAGRVARQALRPDDLIGRIGGDEFVFVLPGTTTDQACRALERLREDLALEQAMNEDPTITLSIGVIDSSTGGTIEGLLHGAARALDHARGQGGNRVVVAQPTASSEP